MICLNSDAPPFQARPWLRHLCDRMWGTNLRWQHREVITQGLRKRQKLTVYFVTPLFCLLSSLFGHPEHWALSNSHEERVFRCFNNLSELYDSSTALFLFNYQFIDTSQHLQYMSCTTWSFLFFSNVFLFSGLLQMQKLSIISSLSPPFPCKQPDL